MTLEVGDACTFAAIYKRRTFWQWLRREPRQLQEWVITATAEAFKDGRVGSITGCDWYRDPNIGTEVHDGQPERT